MICCSSLLIPNTRDLAEKRKHGEIQNICSKLNHHWTTIRSITQKQRGVEDAKRKNRHSKLPC